MSDYLVKYAEKELARSDHTTDQKDLYLEIMDSAGDLIDSGLSPYQILKTVDKLIRGKNITPITNDPSEWAYLEKLGEKYPPGKHFYNLRNSNLISEDGGSTYSYLSEVVSGTQPLAFYKSVNVRAI